MANRVVLGAYSDSGDGNVVIDARLMKKQTGYGSAYGNYDDYSVTTRKDYKSPKPSVQDNGRETQ
jgi:hypothetical protein